MKVCQLFDACATTYDANRPQLVPEFESFYGTLIKQIAFPSDATFRVLDLGAGTGLLTAMLHERFDKAEFLVTDISNNMLKIAKERFAGKPQIKLLNRDNRNLTENNYFDVIISALSLHHLSHPEKAQVYKDCFKALKPSGKFINADQVLGTTQTEERMFEESWRSEVQATGLSETLIKEAQIRMKEDRNARLSDQLDWLQTAGFQRVECWYQRNRFSVFGGIKTDDSI